MIPNSRVSDAIFIQNTEMKGVQIVPVCSLQSLGTPKIRWSVRGKLHPLDEPPIPISPGVYRWSMYMPQCHNRSAKSSLMSFLVPLPHQRLQLTIFQSLVNLAQRCPSSRGQIHVADHTSSTES